MKSLRRTEYIDPGGPGTGGVEGFNDISIHNTILNRNAENLLRWNIHNWGTNILKIRIQILSGKSLLKHWHDTLLLDSFKNDHVGVTKNVRPKKGSYTPAIRDRNQIQRIQTTGLGVLTRKPCHLRNRKLTCDHFLESPNGMSMNDTKNENCWDGNPNLYLW